MNNRTIVWYKQPTVLGHEYAPHNTQGLPHFLPFPFPFPPPFAASFAAAAAAAAAFASSFFFFSSSLFAAAASRSARICLQCRQARRQPEKRMLHNMTADTGHPSWAAEATMQVVQLPTPKTLLWHNTTNFISGTET